MNPARKTRFRPVAGILAAGLGLLLLSGCGVVDALAPKPAANRDADTEEVLDAGEVDVFDVKVGDCLLETSDTEISGVPAVPCGDPHDSEAFHAFDLVGDTFPGSEAVQEQAGDGCVAAFADFIGLPYEESELDLMMIYPIASSWSERNDREVVCLAYDPTAEGGLTSGSLSGAAR